MVGCSGLNFRYKLFRPLICVDDRSIELIPKLTLGSKFRPCPQWTGLSLKYYCCCIFFICTHCLYLFHAIKKCPVRTYFSLMKNPFNFAAKHSSHSRLSAMSCVTRIHTHNKEKAGVNRDYISSRTKKRIDSYKPCLRLTKNREALSEKGPGRRQETERVCLSWRASISPSFDWLQHLCRDSFCHHSNDDLREKIFSPRGSCLWSGAQSDQC